MHRTRKHSKWLIPSIILCVFAVLLSCGLVTLVNAGESSDTPSTGARVGEVAATAAKSAAPTPKASTSKAGPAPVKAVEVREGTWAVPGEVEPGTYVTTGEGHCYWARLSNFEGGFDAIRANGNLSDGERGRITVKRSDKGLELSGDCVWRVAK